MQVDAESGAALPPATLRSSTTAASEPVKSVDSISSPADEHERDAPRDAPEEGADYKGPLEERYGSADTTDAVPDRFGLWRSPQRSRTAYVRLYLEALHYMMRRRGMRELDSVQVSFLPLVPAAAVVA